jgi:tetratricopeptide (TPR) repeat protein
MSRRPIFAALAAAGVISGATLPEAQSDNVFVPELAVIDGAICRLPQAGNRLLLRLAQASTNSAPGRTGIGPTAPVAAQAATAPAPNDDPPLMEGLGKLELKITTYSSQAERFFNQGYRLAWGFNHDEARRAFRKAQRLDPDCAMCFWGEAWVLGPNINAPMDPKANGPALAALRNAQRLASRTTPREQALIRALAARYSPDPKAERAGLDAAFATAMREVAANYSRDNDIATIYADALMNLSPWDYWEAGGARLKAPVAELLDTLEGVLQRRSDHVGAIHLYIHAVEASANPRRAERYADRLVGLMPGAGHIVHMPSHIYYRVGRYKDSLATNRAAVQVDEAYLAKEKPAGIYPLGYYPHNVHFLMVSAQMAGDGPTAIAAASKLSKLIPDDAAREFLLLQPVKAAPYFTHAQFSDSATILALPDPGANFPYIRSIWRYARGVALASKGKVAAARAELAEIERIVARADFRGFDDWKIPARETGRLAAHVLRARIAQGKYDLDTAVRELEAAVKIQDELPYMEPPYWYYSVRQSLGALLVLRGETQRARNVFGQSLARAPNNAWALYGLAEAYAREGRKREARVVARRFERAWIGDTKRPSLATL